MDPISIVGIVSAAVAFGTATTAIAKFSKKLYEVSKEARTEKVAGEVKQFSHQLRFFGSSIETARTAINGHLQDNPHSLILRRLSEENTLKVLKKQTENLLRRMRTVDSDVGKDKNSLDILERVRWVMKKIERDELYLWMERIQCNFMLLGYEIMFETLHKRIARSRFAPSQVCDFNEELKNHQNIMRSHLDFMKDLKERHRALAPKSFKKIEGDFGLRLAERLLKAVAKPMAASNQFNVSTTVSSRNSSRVFISGSDVESESGEISGFEDRSDEVDHASPPPQHSRDVAQFHQAQNDLEPEETLHQSTRLTPNGTHSNGQRIFLSRENKPSKFILVNNGRRRKQVWMAYNSLLDINLITSALAAEMGFGRRNAPAEINLQFETGQAEVLTEVIKVSSTVDVPEGGSPVEFVLYISDRIPGLFQVIRGTHSLI